MHTQYAQMQMQDDGGDYRDSTFSINWDGHDAQVW